MWQLKYKTISEAIDLSRLWRSEQIIDLLRAEGWDFGFPADDVNQYQKDLDRVGKRAKVFLANIQEKVNELKAITDGLTTSEKPDRATMVNNVLMFSKYMGFHIDIYKASAEDYALIRNNYYEQIEALNNGGK